MASGFISGSSQKSGIVGTSGQVDAGIKSSGKVPLAVPAITTYKGGISDTIKVSVDNQNRIIYADLLDSVLKQKGITRVWYDFQTKWLYYDIPTETEDVSRRVAQLPSMSDFNNLTNDVNNLQTLVNSMFDYIINRQFIMIENQDTTNCYTLVINKFDTIEDGD